MGTLENMGGLIAGVVEDSAVSLRDGVFVSHSVGGPTVWDEAAEGNAAHAVISAPTFDEARRKSAGQIEEISGRVDDRTVLLDLGCGYGRLAECLLHDRRLGLYVGVDSAIRMLRLFQSRHDPAAAQGTPVALINSTISDLPIKSGSVDLVVVSAVFLHNHKAAVKRAMDEIKRVLKPGGTLLVFSSFPRRATAMGLQGTLYHWYLSARGRAERNGPVRYYSRAEVTDLLDGFGERTIVPHDFEVLPKSILGLPSRADDAYRRFVSGPVNRLFAGIVGQPLRPAFARHYDVIAVK